MQILIVVLFFTVIFVLVALAIYGSIKEKKTKAAIDFEREKVINTTKKDRLSMMIIFGLYNNEKEEFLKTHDPLKGSISLGQMNALGTEILTELINEEKYKNIFKDEIRSEELKEHFVALQNSRPSVWDKKVFESLNIIKAKSQIILNDEENKELIEEVKKEYEMKRAKHFNNS